MTRRTNRRTGDGESVLPDDECETGHNEANDDGTERTCSGLK